MPLFIPEIVPYLLSILGLLLVWQIHHMHATAGRIQAVNFWDRTGIRMFLQVTPMDAQACEACRVGHGNIILPSVAAKKKFPALQSPCTNPAGCRCQLVGFYGGLPEAQRLRARANNAPGKMAKVSKEKLVELVNAPWTEAQYAKLDRFSLRMLEAVLLEASDPTQALEKYRVVVNEAKSERDTTLIMPASLRMIDILEREKRPSDALEILNKLDKHFQSKPKSSLSPTKKEQEHLSLARTRLVALSHREG